MQHALKMYESIERLNQLGYWMDFELSIDLIMVSLLDSFAQFVLDYMMNYIMSTIPDLINLLKIAVMPHKYPRIFIIKIIIYSV